MAFLCLLVMLGSQGIMVKSTSTIPYGRLTSDTTLLSVVFVPKAWLQFPDSAGNQAGLNQEILTSYHDKCTLTRFGVLLSAGEKGFVNNIFTACRFPFSAAKWSGVRLN